MTILNKQLLHITVEIIVIAGVIFYFSYRHKKLVTRLEEVTKQLEIQAEVIERHEQIINQLITTIQSRSVTNNQVKSKPNENKKPVKRQDSKKNDTKIKQKTLVTKKEQSHEDEDEDENENEYDGDEYDEEEQTQHLIKNKSSNVSFDKKSQIYEFTENSSSEHDSDLDTEIASELNELNEDGLKKKV